MAKALKDYVWLPQPELSYSILFANKLIVDKVKYNEEEMANKHANMLKSLNNEQLHVYEKKKSLK